MGRSKGEDLHNPDFTGGAGRAWDIKDIDAKTDNPALLGGWLIEAPSFARLWSYHIGLLIHLRDEPDTVPSIVERPGATHEFAMCYLHTGYEDTYDPNNIETLRYRVQLPPELEEQLILPNDNRALYVAKLAVEKCVQGVLPPDSRCREDWRAFFRIHENE